MMEPAPVSDREPMIPQKYDLPKTYSDDLSRVAKVSGLTKSQFVRSLVMNFLNKMNATKDA